MEKFSSAVFTYRKRMAHDSLFNAILQMVLRTIVLYKIRADYSEVLFCGYINIQPEVEVFAMIDRYNRYCVMRTERLLPSPVCSYGCTGECHHGDYYEEEVSHHGWWNPSCRFSHINENDFQNLKQTIANRSFESSKKEVAMQALNFNHFSALQVKELLMEFTFESTKLEVAKFAYGHTCDKQNFFVVNDAFTFNSTVDELGRFIAMR